MSDWITRTMRPVRESVPVYTAAFWRGLDRLPQFPITVWFMLTLICLGWVALLLWVLL